MTTGVVTVGLETPAREVAQILLEHGISAVPVVDSTGAPVGIVSEGDLIGRSEHDRLARRDWWLNVFAHPDAEGQIVLARARQALVRASDIMSSPVVTVAETTEAEEIASLLTNYRIKRVPVIRDGRIVGIVSRSDLLRVVEAQPSALVQAKGVEGHRPLSNPFLEIDRHFWRAHGKTPQRAPSPTPPATVETGVTVADFRRLIDDFEIQESRERTQKELAAAAQRNQAIKDLIDHHIADESWKAILQQAREAAAHGGKELLVLRFPSDLCSDGGRAINAPSADWPKTLRGEPAEIYLRWERELRPRGFHLSARVLEFPGGMPGDIGLYLAWGE